MKVRVAVSIDVDREAWADSYGLAPEEVRADVRGYVLQQIRESPAATEQCIRTVEVTDR